MGFSLPSSTDFLAGYLNHQRPINGNSPLFHRLFGHSRGPSALFHPSARLIRGGFHSFPGWEMLSQCWPKTLDLFWLNIQIKMGHVTHLVSWCLKVQMAGFNHLKHILVKLDRFPRDRGENKK